MGKVRPYRATEVFEFYCHDCGEEVVCGADRTGTCSNCGKKYEIVLPKSKDKKEGA